MNIIKNSINATVPLFLFLLIFTAITTNFFTSSGTFFYAYLILLITVIPFFAGMLCVSKLKEIGFNRVGNVIISCIPVVGIYILMLYSVPSGPDVGMGGIAFFVIHIVSMMYFISKSIFVSNPQAVNSLSWVGFRKVILGLVVIELIIIALRLFFS